MADPPENHDSNTTRQIKNVISSLQSPPSSSSPYLSTPAYPSTTPLTLTWQGSAWHTKRVRGYVYANAYMHTCWWMPLWGELAILGHVWSSEYMYSVLPFLPIHSNAARLVPTHKHFVFTLSRLNQSLTTLHNAPSRPYPILSNSSPSKTAHPFTQSRVRHHI